MEKYVIHYTYDTSIAQENVVTDDYDELITKVNAALNSEGRVDVFHIVDGRNILICSNNKLLDLSDHDKYWPIPAWFELIYHDKVIDYFNASIYSEVIDGKICIIASVDINYSPNGKTLENIKNAVTNWMDKYLPAVRHQYGNYILKVNMGEKVTMK